MKGRMVALVAVAVMLTVLVGSTARPAGAQTQVFSGSFGGVYQNTTIRLPLTNLPAHTSVIVDLDLRLRYTWDGETGPWAGPDEWQFGVENGPTWFARSFECPFADADDLQLGPDPCWTTVALYHLRFVFPHSDDSIALLFSGQGLQTYCTCDENWNLPRVEVSVGSPTTIATGEIDVGSIHIRPDGPAMIVDFVTTPGLSLDEAAQSLGYDHFNWLNVVTNSPILDPQFRGQEVIGPDGTPHLVGDLVDASYGASTLPAIPYVDPRRGGYPYLSQLGFVIDNEPLYYNEGMPSTAFGVENHSIDADHDGVKETFRFFDAPQRPWPFTVEYFTGLVGVFPDGRSQLIPGTIVEWEYVSEQGGQVFVADSLNLGLNTSGSVGWLGFIETSGLTPAELSLLLDEGIVIRGDVGGIVELPEVAGTPLEAPDSSGSNTGLLAGIAAAVAAALALGGAASYARRRQRR